MVLQHLEQSNYVIIQGPAAVAPSTPGKTDTDEGLISFYFSTVTACAIDGLGDS
jgi:hypothetical protein